MQYVDGAIHRKSLLMSREPSTDTDIAYQDHLCCTSPLTLSGLRNEALLGFIHLCMVASVVSEMLNAQVLR